MGGLDWNDLRVMIALQKTKSMRAAAERLGLSAATLARKLDELETQLGERLVERMPSGCEITPAGLRILTYAEQMEELAAEIERTRDIQRIEDLEGSVRINADEWVSFFLMLHLPLLHERYPAISIEVITTHRPYSLTRREADISLRPAQPVHHDVVSKRLGQIEYALYGACTYVQKHRSAIDQQRWSELSFVGFDEVRSSFSVDTWLRSLPEAGMPWLRCSYALGIYDGILSGGGLGVLAKFAVERDGRLEAVIPVVPELTQNIWIAYHRGLAGSARVRVVTQFIAEIFEKALC